MNARQFSQWILAALIAAAALPASADECRPVWKGGWINLPPVPEPHMLAGYGRMENPCSQPVSVVSVASPAFMHASLHRSEVVGGVSKMREVDALPVAAKSSATLAQGGLHLMLIHPSAPVKAGDRIAVTFRLKDGREVFGELLVKKATP